MTDNQQRKKTTDKNEISIILPYPTTEYPFRICEYGYTYPDTTYHESTINTPIYRLEYVISGKGIINTKNYTFTVGKGDTYLLHQGDTHNYYSDAKNPMQKIWINVYGVLATELVRIYKLSDVVVFKKVNTFEKLKKMHNLCASTPNADELQIKSAALFLEIIAFLSKQHIDYISSFDVLDNVRSYIDLHITDNVTIGELAKVANLSEQHLTRTFRKKFNITPHQYILKNKLSLAKTLLRSTDKSIDNISEILNLSNGTHLNMLFKKNIGISPTQYRKEHRII